MRTEGWEREFASAVVWTAMELAAGQSRRVIAMVLTGAWPGLSPEDQEAVLAAARNYLVPERQRKARLN